MTTWEGEQEGMVTASERAAVIPPEPAKPRLPERIRAWLASEAAQQGLRWRLWAPVAFGGGAAIYFALRREPELGPLLAGAALTSAVWLGARRLGARRAVILPLMLLACLALGLAVAKLRAERVAAPIAPALAEPTRIEGWIMDVDSPGDR